MHISYCVMLILCRNNIRELQLFLVSFWLCMRDIVVLKVRRQAQHLRLKHYATFQKPPFALLLSQPRLGTGLGGVKTSRLRN